MALRYLTPYRSSSSPARRSSTGGGGLFDLHSQMNRLFDDLFDQSGDSGFYARSGIAAPAMDIHQTESEVEITAELPGVKEEDIDLSVEDGVLTLRGEKKSAREDEESGYRERSYGSFERRITLPADIDEDGCNADFADGVLTIRLPRSEKKPSGRKIPLGKSRSQGNPSEDALIEQRDRQEDNRHEDRGQKQTEQA